MMVTLFRCLNRCGRPVRILYLVVVLFLFTTAGCGSNADTLGCAETTTAHTETDADIEQALITEDPVVPTDPGETDTDINESETDPVETTPAAVESTSPIVTEIPDSAVASPNASPEKISDDELVNVIDYIPSIYTELKYATDDNFTGTVIYDFKDAYLRYGTVKKLAAVQTELIRQGYSLKIWDAYRPVGAQFVLWSVYPDPVYVANPNTGYSSHSRGNAVDVTLVTADGMEIEMPTGFDDFSAMADRDYSDVSAEARNNALTLEKAMSAHGFTGYSGEWWHYSDSVVYPVVDN